MKLFLEKKLEVENGLRGDGVAMPMSKTRGECERRAAAAQCWAGDGTTPFTAPPPATAPPPVRWAPSTVPRPSTGPRPRGSVDQRRCAAGDPRRAAQRTLQPLGLARYGKDHSANHAFAQEGVSCGWPAGRHPSAPFASAAAAGYERG